MPMGCRGDYVLSSSSYLPTWNDKLCESAGPKALVGESLIAFFDATCSEAMVSV